VTSGWRTTISHSVLGIIAWAIVAGVSAPAHAQGPSTLFRYPRVGGVPLDWCLRWGAYCGWPAAHAYCRRRGYARAAGYTLYRPGRTRIYATGQVCRGGVCRAFRSVRCYRVAARHRSGWSWHSNGRSWHNRGRSWHRRNRSWHRTNRSWHRRGRSWHRRGRSWHNVGRSWHRRGRSWHRRGRSWHRRNWSWN
jgi:hypothetical protein